MLPKWLSRAVSPMQLSVQWPVFLARGFPRAPERPTKCQNALLLLIPKASLCLLPGHGLSGWLFLLGCWLGMVFLWNALSTVWWMPASWINPLVPTAWEPLQNSGVSGLRELCPCRPGAEGSREHAEEKSESWVSQSTWSCQVLVRWK